MVTNNAINVATGATGTVLAGQGVGSTPLFTATPTVTSITFGSGNALSTFTSGTSYTPTLTGATSAGTTTYGTQYGIYTQIGNLIFFAANVVITAATGTGDVLISLPFTVGNASTLCSTVMQVTTWPTGCTQAMGNPRQGTTSAKILCCGNGANFAFLQMANASMNITLNGFYSL